MTQGRYDEEDGSYQPTADLYAPGLVKIPHGSTAEEDPPPSGGNTIGANSTTNKVPPPVASDAPGQGPRGLGMADPLAPGQVLFDKYIIERQIGRGGMGTVWLVRHRELDIERALKLIVPGFAIDPNVRARFKREARVMARFSHPNAVTVHDARLTDAAAFIEMEFVRGRSLTQLLMPGVPMPLDWAARIAAQLCDVLQLAHDQGIVHRDLKPSNLMLLDGLPPGQEHLKVLDFGIAKILDPDGSTLDDLHTRPGHFIGTAQYSSPEQAGETSVDGRSDLYSVGVLLYEFLTGYRPFSGPAVIHDHCCTPPPPFAERNPDVYVPGEIEALVLQCLAKDPADRPPSARALAEAFQRALPSTIVPLASTSPLPPRPPLGHVTLLAPPLGFAPLSESYVPILGTDGPTRVQERSAGDVAVARRQPSRASRTWRYLGAAVGLAAAVVAIGLLSRLPGTSNSPPLPPRPPLPRDAPRASVAATNPRPSAEPFVLPPGFRVADQNDLAHGWPRVLLRQADDSRFLLIEGGSFTMGALDAFPPFPDDQNTPAHRVTLSSFYMQETEVTNGQLEAYFHEVDPGGHTKSYQDWHEPYSHLMDIGVKPDEARRHPASRVSHRTASEFASWAGGQLPTEAQWEYAARSLGQERLYVWADQVAPIYKRANISSIGVHPAPLGSEDMPTVPVGFYHDYDRTEQGILDLTGNVREWCRDVWDKYAPESQVDPQGPPRPRRGQAAAFVVRGGAFDTANDEFRTTGPRRHESEVQVSNDLGFRLVVECPSR